MSSFSCFACWQVTALRDTLAIDAAAPEDSVFLATHQPAPIFRRTPGSDTDVDIVSEQIILDDLLGSSADPVLIPIIGASGTGKSHLVRWLKAALDRNDPGRHVIYLPKYRTSLRGVIESITEGFEGAEFQEIRNTLRETADNLNEREAPAELLNKLAAAFETAQPDPGAPRTLKDSLLGEDGLALLLYDRSFRRELLGEDGIIRKFVHEAMFGREEHDSGEGFRFRVEDLPIAAFNSGEANHAARALHGRLAGSLALQEAAAEMLSEYLQPAVRNLIGVRTDQLGGIFQRVRELLLQQGKELILLIEDFSVLQAIQRELLDALIVPAAEQGRQRFCVLRTAMAVTDGYFGNLFHTVKTRLRNVYSLDVALEKVGSDDVVSFAARYLNAARLGAETITTARGTRADIRDLSWLPNACDACRFQEECHAAFGVSPQGYGLYPFNRTALVRTVNSKLRRAPKQRFDPRTILSGVIWDLLDVRRGAIVQGNFPDGNFADNFYDAEAPILTSTNERRLMGADPVHWKRRMAVLNFWAEDPNRPDSLATGVLDAFDLPALLEPVVTPPSAPPVRDLSPAAPPPTHVAQPVAAPVRDSRAPAPVPPLQDDPVLAEKLAAIRQWERGDALPQAMRRELRKRIHQAVLEAVDREALPLYTKAWFDAGGFFTHEKIGMDPQDAEQEDLVVLDSTNIDDRLALEALVRFDAIGNWHFEDGAEHFRLLRRAVERWSEPVRARIAAEMDDTEATDAARALMIGSAVLGFKGVETDDPASILETFFQPVPAAPTGTNRSKWDELRTVCITGGQGRETRRQLVERFVSQVATFKGTSSQAQALDAVRVATLLADQRERIADPLGGGRTSPAAAHLQRVLQLLDAAVAERHAILVQWEALVRSHLGDELGDPAALVESINAAMAEAQQWVGLDGPYSLTEVKKLGFAFLREDPAGLLSYVRRCLHEYEGTPLLTRVLSLALVADRRLEAVRDYLTRVDFEFDSVERKLCAEQSQTDGIRRALEQAKAALVEETRGTGDDMEAITLVPASAPEEQEEELAGGLR